MRFPLWTLATLVSLSALSQSSSSKVGGTVVLSQCEGPFCFSKSHWTFHDGEGRGVWERGSLARMLITKVDGNAITIVRTDDGGPSKDLTGVYEGTIKGNKIAGRAVWTFSGLNWPNNQASSNWSATVVEGTAAGLVPATTHNEMASTSLTLARPPGPMKSTASDRLSVPDGFLQIPRDDSGDAGYREPCDQRPERHPS